jgi:hypothetical protein
MSKCEVSIKSILDSQNFNNSTFYALFYRLKITKAH